MDDNRDKPKKYIFEDKETDIILYEYYEQIDKLFEKYDETIEEVHLKRLSKDKAYYQLCRILFEFKNYMLFKDQINSSLFLLSSVTVKCYSEVLHDKPSHINGLRSLVLQGSVTDKCNETNKGIVN